MSVNLIVREAFIYICVSQKMLKCEDHFEMIIWLRETRGDAISKTLLPCIVEVGPLPSELRNVFWRGE